MKNISRKTRMEINMAITALQLKLSETLGVKVFLKAKVHNGTIEDCVHELFERMTRCWDDVQLSDFQKKSRKKELVTMKKIMSMAARVRIPKASYRMIGTFLGNLDHGTVMHHEDTGYNLLETQDALFMHYYEPVKHFFNEGEAEQ